jgi:predicted anti-sigma-YlaC factor YlaD
MNDNHSMECATCREAVSARLDEEDEPAPAAETDAHLTGCAACREWQAAAIVSSRLLRVRPAVSVPDLTEAIMATAPIPSRGRLSRSRVLLGVVGVCQLALAWSQIFGGADVGQTEHSVGQGAGHLFNESTAWNLALGVGFYWAAWRPRAAAGLIPAVAGFVVVLLGYSAYDLIAGSATAARVVGHGLVVAGLVLLILVRHSERTPAPGHGQLQVAPEHDIPDVSEDPDLDTGPTNTPQGRHLRPAGRDRAA